MRVWVVSVPDEATGDAVDQQRGVRDDERLPDRPQGDDRVRADVAGHRGRGPQRVGPLPEEQLVDHPSQDHACRLVGERGQGCEHTQGTGVQLVGAPSASSSPSSSTETDTTVDEGRAR